MEQHYQNRNNEVWQQATVPALGLPGNIVLTLEQLIPQFADYIVYDLRYSPNTAKKYTESLRWIMRDLPHLVYPQDLTLPAITELKKRTLLRGASESRANSIIFPLRKFLAYCHEVHGIVTINPRDIKPMKIPKRDVIYLKPEEIEQFVRVMPTTTIQGLRMRALVEILLSTAMRISEALSINKDDIDWEGKEVTIIGKGNKQRTVFLNDRAISWVQMYLLRRKDSHPSLFVTFGQPKKLSTYDLSRQFKGYARNAGLKKKVTPHILRHTAATIMSHKGADIRVIQQILGHSDIETTARYYLGTDKTSLKEAHAKFLRYD
jgi:site-specific recombinase XerD